MQTSNRIDDVNKLIYDLTLLMHYSSQAAGENVERVKALVAHLVPFCEIDEVRAVFFEATDGNFNPSLVGKINRAISKLEVLFPNSKRPLYIFSSVTRAECRTPVNP